MRRTHGSRQGTRTIASRSKSERGRLFIRRVMHPYEEGDKVAIVIDGGHQKGMPHRRFQTITGKQGRAYVLAIKDGNMAKTIVARPEHLRPLE